MDSKFERSAESQAKADAYTARLEAAEKALREHPMTKARREWDSVARSFDIWNRNTAELQALLRHAENDDKMTGELVTNIGPRDVAQEFYKALDQRLHNMIAAAISLVDHARILLNGYAGTPFETEHKTRNDAVWGEPRTQFLRGLRNLLLHFGHAPIRTSVVVNSEGTVTKILLSSPDLLGEHEWTRPARAFIEANPDGIHLSAEVDAYAQSVAALYRWIFEQFETLHGADIDELNLLIAERNLALTNDAFASKEESDKHALQGWADMKAREGETE